MSFFSRSLVDFWVQNFSKTGNCCIPVRCWHPDLYWPFFGYLYLRTCVKRVDFARFWPKLAQFGPFDEYNCLIKSQYACLLLSIVISNLSVVILMDNNNFYFTWPSKLALDGWFWGKFYRIWANSSPYMVGSLWSGTSHNMKKLGKVINNLYSIIF